MADAVMRVIDVWQIPGTNIIGMCFDTTASNTGVNQGSGTYVEADLEKACLWLACRHHIGERHITHADTITRGPSNG